jgi:hypothetical protein
MIKTAFLVALTVTALASMPAHAQRVFVSGLGLETNPCTVTQPCRTFQQAHNTVAVNGEIDVLDPAGYGPLTITKGISVQAHGFGEITATSGGTAIAINVTTADPVSLNGLIIDGGGTGGIGIDIQSGPSVEILNSVVRHFQVGIRDFTTTPGSNLLIEDTIASNSGSGITVNPIGSNGRATLNRITANNNQRGVSNAGAAMQIANSVLSNNSQDGLSTGGGVTWLAKSVISGNTNGLMWVGR